MSSQSTNNFVSHGELYLIFGPMFGGKTQTLIYLLAIHEGVISVHERMMSLPEDEDRHRILVIKPECDDRSDDETIEMTGNLSTHRLTPNRLGEERVKRITVSRLEDVPLSDLDKHQVIGIDEAQFFDNLKTIVLKWVITLKKRVYVSGLLATSEGTMFGEIYKLIPFVKSQNMIKIDAVCVDCVRESRDPSSRPPAWLNNCLVEKGGDVLVGSDIYTPVCLRHWKGKY